MQSFQLYCLKFFMVFSVSPEGYWNYSEMYYHSFLPNPFLRAYYSHVGCFIV
jgi:hypothetical protein